MCDPLTIHATSEHFCNEVTLQRRAISSVLYLCVCCCYVDSSLSQQYSDLPVLGSLLAGLLLPVHASDTNIQDDMTSTRTPATTSQQSRPPPWTSSHLLPITHGLRAGANVAEICERLQELDEISKRRVDVLEHFVVGLHFLIILSSFLTVCHRSV